MGRIGKKIDGDELRAAYAEHGSIKKLASLFHTSNNRMMALLEQNGIKTKNVGNKIEIKRLDVKSMINDYVSKNMTMQEVCEKHNIKVDKLRDVFRENGVNISKWHGHIKRKTTSKIGFIKQIASMFDELGIAYQKNYSVMTNCTVSLKANDICIDVYKNKDLIDYDGYKYRLRLKRKRDVCTEKGLKLIQIFEDEYKNKPDIVLSKLRHIFSCSEHAKRVPGRKCIIEEIKTDVAKEFLNKYHIQGFVGSTVYLGAMFNGELVGVMSFSNDEKRDWCLTRFASDDKCICQGIGGKLFKYFIRKFSPTNIYSFADRRWTISETDNLYIKIGFNYDGIIGPNYFYSNDNDYNRLRKEKFRKQVLIKKHGFSPELTEMQMVKELGYGRIWDSGLFKYVWKSLGD